MITLDYLAGFIDGEGSFSVSVDQNTFRFAVSIANSNYEILKQIQNTFGGNITESKRNVKYKRAWRLYWQQRKAIEIATILKDKLIIKKEQAEIFSQIIIRNKNQKLSEELREQRVNAFAKVKKLNNCKRYMEKFDETLQKMAPYPTLFS